MYVCKRLKVNDDPESKADLKMDWIAIVCFNDRDILKLKAA